MKKAYIIIMIFIVVFSISGYLGYNKYKEFTQTRPIEFKQIVVNNETINYTKYEITHSFSNGKIKQQHNKSADQEVQRLTVKDNKLNIQSDSEVEITIKGGTSTIFEGSALDLEKFRFEKPDEYLVTVRQTYQDKYGTGFVGYVVFLDVESDPKVTISNEKPKQGELVKIEVTGAYKDTNVSVKGEFLPSHTFYNDKGNIEVYIPITYYKPAEPYNMSISVGEKEIPFTLDVQKADFTQLHFTVDESVSNSTVNSAAANTEYRNKIHPLYRTMDSNKYWDGKFIKPIQEKRISSTFGQERYVNNAKTPQRHSGIDYAAPEGTSVYATNKGKVEFSEFVQLTGNTIVIDHGLGVKSYHFHLSELNIKAGEIVEKGQLIGKVGTTGYSTGPHLHFQMSIQNQPINPELMYELEY